MARLCTVSFLSALRTMAARCKLPFCPPPWPAPKRLWCAPRKSHRKRIEQEKEQKKARPVPYSSSPADALKEGVGRNSGSSSPAPNSPAAASSSASASLSSPRSRRSLTSYSDASLPASSAAGTLLPTSVVERKSRIAWLHVPPAKRSRIFHRLFHLPVSFDTSARS